MRILDIGTHRFTQVQVNDEPGAGNANHEYVVVPISQEVPGPSPVEVEGAPVGEGEGIPEGEPAVDSEVERTPDNLLAQVSFQNGPIKESGVNGCHNEDLIAIVIDRLRGFQSGDFKCRENEMALRKMEAALSWLNDRTKARIARGVEGTHVI